MNGIVKYFSTTVFILVLFMSSCTSRGNQILCLTGNEINFDINQLTDEPIDTISGVTAGEVKTGNGFAIVNNAFDSCCSGNGHFKLKLTDNLCSSNLLPPDIKLYDTIKISDPLAKISSPASFCAYKAGKYKGKFVYTNVDSTQYSNDQDISYSEVVFVYSDRNVSISGQYLCPAKEGESYRMNVKNYDLALNKGWNAICYSVYNSDPMYREVVYSTESFAEGMKWLFVKDNII